MPISDWPEVGRFVQLVGIPFAALILVGGLLGYLLLFVLTRLNGKLDQVATGLVRATEALQHVSVGQQEAARAHADTVAALGQVQHTLNNLIEHLSWSRRAAEWGVPPRHREGDLG